MERSKGPSNMNEICFEMGKGIKRSELPVMK